MKFNLQRIHVYTRHKIECQVGINLVMASISIKQRTSGWLDDNYHYTVILRKSITNSSQKK